MALKSVILYLMPLIPLFVNAKKGRGDFTIGQTENPILVIKSLLILNMEEF